MSSRSLLVRPDLQAGWWLSVYPDAGEGGGCFVYQRPRRWVRGGPASNPERARAEAARRARGRLRRYCAANRLNRLGTLTYGPPFCRDPRQARADVGVFFRALREATGGDRFAYAWVPEFHADGERLHLHFAVGRYLPRVKIEQAWGHGFVHIKLLSGLPVGSGQLEEARRAAGYLSKYVTKSFHEPALKGLHRFDVAQGFQPQKVRLHARTESAVIDQASQLMGSEPSKVWSSGDLTEWHGPPAVWVSWGR